MFCCLAMASARSNDVCLISPDAICAAPTVLAAAGVIAGRAVTSHPSVARELGGAAYREDAVVADGPVITSRGAGTAMEFALTLVETLVDRTTAERLRQQMVVPALAR